MHRLILMVCLASLLPAWAVPGSQPHELNIKDFGAKGDGQSNDTPALLAAMDKAKRAEGTIYFPTGEYCIHPVKLPSHITLRGDSAWAEYLC